VPVWVGMGSLAIKSGEVPAPALPSPIEWSLWTITIQDRHCKPFSVWKGTRSRSWQTAPLL
jgi:hypothetical protein